MGDVRGTIVGNALKIYKIRAGWNPRITTVYPGDFFIIY
jgi:hypothetical protein